MAAPIIPLQTIQAGLETTRGTAVAATHVVDFTPGSATLKRDVQKIRVRNAGSLATSHRSYAGREIVEIDFAGPWTYDRAPMWLNMALAPVATGINATADKLWTFGTINDTADDLKAYTFEVGGKDTWPNEYQVAGCVMNSLEIDVKQDGVWTYKASIWGYKVVIAAKTAALSFMAAPTDVLGLHTKVYIDPTTIGTTQQVGRIVSANFKIDQGFDRRFTLDSQSSAYRIALIKERKVTAKIVAEYDAQINYTAWAADTAQKVRIKAQGAVLGSSFYISQFDFYGTWDSLVLGQDQGVVTTELNLMGRYDTTAATDVGAAITTTQAALP